MGIKKGTLADDNAFGTLGGELLCGLTCGIIGVLIRGISQFFSALGAPQMVVQIIDFISDIAMTAVESIARSITGDIG